MCSLFEIIKKDKEKCDTCRRRIDNYLNKSSIKSLSNIQHYLRIELSLHQTYFITWDGKLKNVYRAMIPEYYSRFTVHLCFPKDNIRIICPERYAERLYYSQHLLTGDFKEKCIKFRFYDNETKTICNGPQIIISMAELPSIICDNGKNLEEFLKSI